MDGQRETLKLLLPEKDLRREEVKPENGWREGLADSLLH